MVRLYLCLVILLKNNNSNDMMKYMMMAQIFGSGGKVDGVSGFGNSFIPLVFMMNGGFDKMFDGVFDVVNTVNTVNSTKED